MLVGKKGHNDGLEEGVHCVCGKSDDNNNNDINNNNDNTRRNRNNDCADDDSYALVHIGDLKRLISSSSLRCVRCDSRERETTVSKIGLAINIDWVCCGCSTSDSLLSRNTEGNKDQTRVLSYTIKTI